MIVAMIAAQLVAAAGLLNAQNSEQEELLAWATTLRYQARVEQAMSVCEMMIEGDPDCVDAWVEHGVLALSAGLFEEAMQDFCEALEREPNHAMALVGRAHAYHAFGDSNALQRDAAKALQRCNRTIDVGGANDRTWYVRGLAKMLLRDERALQDFATAVSLNPANMDARSERAHVYRATGRRQAAIDELTRAVELRPDYAVGYLSRARLHYENQDLDASIADCNRSLEINPQYAQAWHNRGVVNVERGEIVSAVSDLSQAISVQPDYASAHVYRGQAYFALGSPDEAKADWERTQELEPNGWAGQVAGEMLEKLKAAESPESPD